MKKLLESRRFWLAMLAAFQTILLQFAPNFPQEVWLSIDAVLLVVILAYTVNDVTETITSALVEREEIVARMYNQQELSQ